MYPIFYLLLLLFFSGCSGLEQSEKEKIRRLNAKGEMIYRTHEEQLYTVQPPVPKAREKYPWENSLTGKHSKISKEFFRCKGSSMNPTRLDEKAVDRGISYSDCGGQQKHSLCLRGEKEFVYPILIELLNHVQEKTNKKVIITCGYRCPVHNLYADPTPANQSSKHMIGAEVDFYVQGLEQKPEEVIKILMDFYKEAPLYKGKKEYEIFQRSEKPDARGSLLFWMNKEVAIKLFKKEEGRDFDNRHPYPYLTLQVRFDRELDDKVLFTKEKATAYRRY